MIGWVGSGEDFCGLGWVGLGFEKVTHDQLWANYDYTRYKRFYSVSVVWVTNCQLSELN